MKEREWEAIKQIYEIAGTVQHARHGTAQHSKCMHVCEGKLDIVIAI